MTTIGTPPKSLTQRQYLWALRCGFRPAPDSQTRKRSHRTEGKSLARTEREWRWIELRWLGRHDRWENQ